jgi:UDP:flavonoid glycosyltransferase YjiC (YdhE family)
MQNTPVIYGLSPSVIPHPSDWDSRTTHICGYWFLEPADDWRPPTDLLRFIENGPPPVYIGFGSMSNQKPEQTADLVLQALKRTGQRAIVFSGWGGMQKAELPDSVLMVDSTPHSWLFPHTQAVVHHGGAGTTAAGLRAGKPSIIIPYHGDQLFWGKIATDLGVGPKPVPRKKLTVDNLAQAIERAVTDKEMHRKAAELGKRIQTENGIARAIEIIQQHKGSVEIYSKNT